MLSRFMYIFCVALMCYTSLFFYPRWQKERTEATISWDVSGYYWYLPSVFIYHDLKGQSFKDSIMNKYRPTGLDFQQGMRLDNGNFVMKYSSGMAVMYLPFFLTAHWMAGLLHYPQDGFSPPYQLGIQLGGLLVAILGLWYWRKLMLYYFSDKVVAITLGLLVIGSNYLNYAAVDCGMSHAWLFTIYVFILLNIKKLYEHEFSLKYAVRVGLLIGLAMLTRPTEIIAFILLLEWGMEKLSITSLTGRLKFLLKQYKPMLVAGLCAFLVFSIQLIYWKYVSGHWFVYSYGDQGFYWSHPHFYDYTIGYRSGWLRYSPTMLFAFIGIIPLALRGRNKVALITFFLVNYYIVAAWDIWWYGGRAMIQSYPVLLFAVASLVEVALEKRIFTILFTPFALLFTYANIWWTIQAHGGGLLDGDCMTKSYYWRVIGRWDAPERTLQLRDQTEVYEGDITNRKLLYKFSFKSDTGNSSFYETENGTRWLVLDKDRQYSPVYGFPFSGDGSQWMRVEATFKTSWKEWDVWRMAQFITELVDTTGNKSRVVKTNFFRVYRLLKDNEMKALQMDVRLPGLHYDSVRIRFWNAESDKRLQIAGVRVETFDSRK